MRRAAISTMLFVAVLMSGPAWARDAKLLGDNNVFIDELYNAPVPATRQEIGVTVEILRYAGKDHDAIALGRYLERVFLLEFLGEATPVKPRPLRDVVSEFGYRNNSLPPLRARALESSVAVEVLASRDPGLRVDEGPSIFRYEGASVWSRLKAGPESEANRQLIGMRVRNTSRMPIQRGAFTMTLEGGAAKNSIVLRCVYGTVAPGVAPGASVVFPCINERPYPLADLLGLIAGLATGASRSLVWHNYVTFGTGDELITIITNQGTNGIGGDSPRERALKIIKDLPCKTKNTCGQEVEAQLGAHPMLSGGILGLLASALYFLVYYVLGSRSAAKFGFGSIAVVGIVLAAVGIVVTVMLLLIHPVFAFIIGGFVVGQLGIFFAGFVLGFFLPFWLIAQFSNK